MTLQVVIDISNNSFAIGFFDSGVGGVSVLAEAACLLPYESLIYFGDSAHAPYGTKEIAEIKRLSMKAAEFLVDKGIKALVVACNTATSVAINDLRQKLSIPVIGMEPALKPAVEMDQKGKIVVMATPITLREEKFQTLLHQYNKENRIVSLSCPGLAELIEQGHYQGPRVKSYLAEKFSHLNQGKVSTIVLGCTHYVFIKNEIKKLIPDVKLVDGNLGTVKRLMCILAEKGLLANQTHEQGKITWFSSGNPDVYLPLSNRMFSFYIQG